VPNVDQKQKKQRQIFF